MEKDELKPCPFCKERIQAAAIKCRYCGEWLEQPPQMVQAARHEEEPRPRSEETAISPCVEPRPAAADKPPLLPIGEVTVPQAPTEVLQFSFLTLKQMRVGSIGLLVMSIAVMWFTLRDANFSNPNAVEKLSELISRTLISAAIFSWLVWSGTGKRKGYGFLTFSVVCAIMTFVFVYYFDLGDKKSREQDQALGRQMAGSLNEFANQVTNDGPMAPLAPTGNAELDEGLRPIVDLVNDFKAALGRMETDIREVNQLDVFSASVLANQISIDAEIRKRDDCQEIITKYQQEFPVMIESARAKYATLKISDEAKEGLLRGFDKSMKSDVSTADEMFSLRIRRENADSDLLRFLLTEFGGFRLVDGSVTFEVPAKQEEFKRLSQNIDTVINEAKAFQQRQVEALEAAKGQIKKLGE